MDQIENWTDLKIEQNWKIRQNSKIDTWTKLKYWTKLKNGRNWKLDRFENRTKLKIRQNWKSNKIQNQTKLKIGQNWKLNKMDKIEKWENFRRENSYLYKDYIGLESIYQMDQNFCSFSFRFVQKQIAVGIIVYAKFSGIKLLLNGSKRLQHVLVYTIHLCPLKL